MFRYTATSPLVLKNIYLHIPENKVTAIVGGSGSGKSTLLKLLIRLYQPTYGDIKMGGMNVNAINLREWRSLCGVVMQDGRLFSDTILNNIVLEDEHIDYARLHESCRIAQIEDEINSMPKGYDTVIGETGRVDTLNERRIVDALTAAFERRTVVVVAHRLSTIRNADQIVVMHEGKIVEVGDHPHLMEHRGYYYRLVASQAEVLSPNT